MRDTHRLEVASLADELGTLKDNAANHAAELAKANTTAKEEEEKRSKSISLLKALRQKLVKAEAAKEEAERSSERERDAIRVDRVRFQSDLTSTRAEKEAQIAKLRSGFEREVNSVRAQYERELQAKKGQAELDVVTLKAAHARELSTRESRSRELEERLRKLERERDSLFDDGQIKAAELESARAWSVTLEARLEERTLEANSARESEERLKEELADLTKQKAVSSPALNQQPDLRSALNEAEAKSAGRISILEGKIRQLERERTETEDEMGRNMEQRLGEVERMRREIARRDTEYEEGMRSAEARQQRAEQAERKVRELEDRARGLEGLLDDMREEAARSGDRQVSAKQRGCIIPVINDFPQSAVREELTERDSRVSELEGRIEELQMRESQVKATNKVRLPHMTRFKVAQSFCRHYETSCAKCNLAFLWQRSSETQALATSATMQRMGAAAPRRLLLRHL